MKHRLIELFPIGIIHSPFREKEGMPLQPIRSQEAGVLEVFPDYEQGLQDIEGFSHLILLYHFHQEPQTRMLVKSYLEDSIHGVFATRSPKRPNHLGISTVELVQREGNLLRVFGIDVLDQTPLLDIKPYIPRIDDRAGARSGWLQHLW
ncbi:MAG: tRNA (N6-threonylcarbamoyladenosine(37)-N6)-methyltransferase TrmO [bacterium]